MSSGPTANYALPCCFLREALHIEEPIPSVPIALPKIGKLGYEPIQRNVCSCPLEQNRIGSVCQGPEHPTYRAVAYPFKPYLGSIYMMAAAPLGSTDFYLVTGDVLPAAAIPWPISLEDGIDENTVFLYDVVNTSDASDYFSFFMGRCLSTQGDIAKLRPSEKGEFLWDGFICHVYHNDNHIADIYDAGLPAKDGYPKYTVVEFVPGSRKRVRTLWEPFIE